MNSTLHDPPPRRPARARGRRPAIILLGSAVAGSCLLLAACSAGSSAGSAASNGSAAHAVPAPGEVRAAAPDSGQVPGGAAQAASLTLSSQSIIYTANLAVRARDVAGAAARAGQIVTAAGGYIASEHESASRGHAAASTASLELKIPVDAYPATLSKLSASLGTVTSVTRQARDVTQQVADVTSRVTSAETAIAQLRALLRRAGSVSSLLEVQNQISSQESGLEALQAEQRALSRQTSYATVSLQLTAPPAQHPPARHHHAGFLAGLSGGWRALRVTVSGLLTALGALLPFLVIAGVATGLGFGGRRLRRSRSAPPGPQQPGPTVP